jgi:ketosteroid isomerase-like protein
MAERRSYAEDRAEIENLQARYMFAIDWRDAKTYAETFTEDGELDWARGTIKGRKAIQDEFANMGAMFGHDDGSHKQPIRLRHFITNLALKIDGDRAIGRAYWFEFHNELADRKPYVRAYGHYEDEMRRVEGEWLFSRRKILNEFLEGRRAEAANPAW